MVHHNVVSTSFGEELGPTAMAPLWKPTVGRPYSLESLGAVGSQINARD
jgi:hypothetical protein